MFDIILVTPQCLFFWVLWSSLFLVIYSCTASIFIRPCAVVVSTSASGAEDPGFESQRGQIIFTINLLGTCLSLGAVHYLGIGRGTGD